MVTIDQPLSQSIHTFRLIHDGAAAPALHPAVFPAGKTRIGAIFLPEDQLLVIGTPFRERIPALTRSSLARGLGIRRILAPEEIAVRFSRLLARLVVCDVVHSSRMRLMFGDAITAPHVSPPGRFRVAEEGDRRAVIALLAAGALGRIPMSPERLADRTIGNHLCYVWDNGGPVAMALFGPNDAVSYEIRNLFTLPGHRGRGYAAGLVTGLHAHVGAVLGLSTATLFVDEADAAAERLYRRLGFHNLNWWRYMELTGPREASGIA